MKKAVIWAALLSVICFSKVCFSQDTESGTIKVKRKINEYLDSAFAFKGKHPISLRIQSALSKATTEREKEGNSRNIVLRDSEYYLHGLYATAAGDVRHTVGAYGVTVYVALKYAAYAAKEMGVDWFEEFLRTDPDKPTSEPGGILWAYSGLCDGMKIDGKDEVTERTPHGLTIFSCDITEPIPISPPTGLEIISSE